MACSESAMSPYENFRVAKEGVYGILTVIFFLKMPVHIDVSLLEPSWIGR